MLQCTCCAAAARRCESQYLWLNRASCIQGHVTAVTPHVIGETLGAAQAQLQPYADIMQDTARDRGRHAVVKANHQHTID